MKDAMLEFNKDVQNTRIDVVNSYKEHVIKDDSKILMTGYAQCQPFAI